MKYLKQAILAFSLIAVPVISHGTIISSADVGGLSTFSDTTSGMTWLRLDNFYDSSTGSSTYSYTSMVSTAETAGFTVSDSTTLFGMLDTLALGSGQWSSYASIMGYGQPRNLIWGALADWDDGVTTPYAWASQGASSWSLFTGNDSNCNTLDIGSCNSVPSQDLGLWAYMDNNSVPEPSVLALMGLGLVGLGFARRRKQQA